MFTIQRKEMFMGLLLLVLVIVLLVGVLPT